MNTGCARGLDLIEDQVHQIREIVGAKSDSDLAGKLGLGRTAVARWKQRGVIPPEYLALIDAPRGQIAAFASQFIVHRELYRHADHHYWLRAALQFLPADYGSSLPAAERARTLDFVLTRLIGAALDATVRELGKPRCEGEEDYRALVDILASGSSSGSGLPYAERIARILAEGMPVEGSPFAK